MSCWSLVSFYFSGLRATWIPSQHVAPPACHAARRPACPWLACGGRHGPRRSRAHRGVTRQPWQPDDTRFCVSYHFANHMRFISVRLGTPTQSVKPVGLVQLKEKLCESKASWWNLPVRRRLTAPALQMGVERHPYYSVFQQTWKQMWLDIPACPLLLPLLLLIMPGVLFRLSPPLLL